MDYVVIMAGGTGKRLWPLSRKKHPKQVLKLFEGKTLLNNCFERLAPVFDKENIIVLTNINYLDIVRKNLPDIPPENVIAEPDVRDTAAAIGLAAAILTKKDPDATMAIVTADQLIEPPQVLQQAIKDAIAFVNKNHNSLVTFGIKPTFPSTQLGYIKCVNPEKYSECQNDVYTVEAFKEKPDEQTAEQYLNSGQFFWNSGMFVWKAKTILDKLEKLLPDSTEPLKKIKNGWGTANQQQTLEKWFVKIPKISIDYAVMEKTDNVHAIKLDCRWLDLGSFIALADFISSDTNNNIVVADSSELIDCRDSIIVTEDNGHLIACMGLDNIVVAHSPNATLVCHVGQIQRLKELLQMIEQNKDHKFL